MGYGAQLKYFAKGTQPDLDIGGLFEPFSRSFDYLDWIARLTSHVPDKGMQLTHYFGAYANAHRGKEAKSGSTSHADALPGKAPTEPEEEWIISRRKTWARLLKHVYESDPLLCNCGGTMKITSVI